MSERGRDAWFHGLDRTDLATAADRIRSGSAPAPQPWPTIAQEAALVPDGDAYDTLLHDAAMQALRDELAAAAAAADREVIHAIRALDDLDRITNELTERVAEWLVSRDIEVIAGPPAIEAATSIEPASALDHRLIALAQSVETLEEERNVLEQRIEQSMSVIAPNLAALAGPLLGARLLSLAGSLERLAKLPSGTVQVLGAEDALFAHLQGHAPSPKHGVIYTHEYVRETHPSNRGSAARALAGKLSIAARIDHYAGDLRPELGDELDERIRHIRRRNR